MISKVDIAIILIYLIGIFAYSLYRSFSNRLEVSGFLNNNQSTGLLTLVFSIVSTNVGSGFFLAVAAEGYQTGISFGISMVIVSCVTSVTIALMAGKVKSFTDPQKISTISELLSVRYSSRSVSLVASLVIVFGYVFVTALQLVGIGHIGSAITGVNFNSFVILGGILTVVYTSIGGLKSNFAVDSISFLIIMFIMPTVVILTATSDRVDLSSLPSSYFDIFSFGGASFFVLSIVLSIVSAFMFMELWQRIMSVSSVKVAKKAFYISAFLQPVLIGSGIYLGLIAANQYTGIEKSSAIFRVFVDFLPSGILGLGLVGVLAVLMSTINSLILVGGSTIYTGILGHRTKNNSVLLTLKISTLMFGIFSLMLAFLYSDIVKLLLMGAFIMLPICPAIIWALFSEKTNSKVAVTSIVLGIVTTFSLITIMPDVAFAPGFLVSLLIITFYHFVITKIRGGK